MNKKQKLIKELFSGMNPKRPAILEVAHVTSVSFGYAKNTYLCDSGNWSIPEEKQDAVIAALKDLQS